MEFKVSSSELQKRLQIISGVIGTNKVIPILDDYLFEIKGTTLTISGSDMETTIRTRTTVKADMDGIVAVPAKTLFDTLKALPEQPLRFRVDEETMRVEVTSAFGKYSLAGEPGEDFPEIPVAMDADKVVLTSPALNRGITHTIFATSNDELRPNMTGVYFQVDMNKLTMVATDAHKLVKHTLLNIESNVSTSFIVPKKGLSLLKNALPPGGEVTVAFDDANVFFTFEDTEFTIRLIDAKYPDYHAVIPVNNSNELVIDRNDFLNSLKRISIYANKTTNQVLLNITEDFVNINAQDLDFSNEATEKLRCTYNGEEEMTIGFNAKFLVEMLSVLESDNVLMKLSIPSKAGILYPEEQEDDEDLLMLVMPVMLKA